MVSRYRTYIFGGLTILIVAGALWSIYFFTKSSPEEATPEVTPITEEPEITQERINPTPIGSSVEDRPIEVYTYGTGDTHLLFVGGMHGGYEWNSVLLAYELIDYLEAPEHTIPLDLTIHIIPALNPDGLFRVTGKVGRFLVTDIGEAENTGAGRFNAHNVDLNRNFDCKWKPTATWKGNTVSAGTAAFSEPEAQTLRTYVETIKPTGVVFWHSKANAVYASECTAGILPGTRTLMDTYAKAAQYPSVDVFDAYPVTGDAEGWLASIGIPAITVELSSHESIELQRNLSGFSALIEHYTTAK